MKVIGWGNDNLCKQKLRAKTVILISDKINFEDKKVIRNKDTFYNLYYQRPDNCKRVHITKDPQNT